MYVDKGDRKGGEGIKYPVCVCFSHTTSSGKRAKLPAFVRGQQKLVNDKW